RIARHCLARSFSSSDSGSVPRGRRGHSILLFDPWSNEEKEFGLTLDGLGVFEQMSDERNTAETGNLPNVKRISIDEDAANHHGVSIRHSCLSLRMLGRYGGHAIDSPGKVRLAVLDIDDHEYSSIVADLWCHIQP